MRLAATRAVAEVVGRGLCRFRYLPFGTLPKADRLGYLQVQITAWAPFAHADYVVVSDAVGAAVLAWDAARLAEQRAAAGLNPASRLLVAPESLLHEPLQAEGATLRRCSEGCEGQVWRAGRLVASRWWPQTPEPAAWLNFQRGAGLESSRQATEPPNLPETPVWAPRPWAPAQRLSELLERDRLYLHGALALALLLMLLPTLWLVRSGWAAQTQAAALMAQRHTLEAAARPGLEARAAALDALSQLETLLAQVDRVAPVSLLAHLSRCLPADGSRLLELDWEGRRLRLVLEPAPGTPRTVYVRAFESGGRLRDIRELAQDQIGEAQGLVLAAELAERPPASAPEPPSAPEDAETGGEGGA